MTRNNFLPLLALALALPASAQETKSPALNALTDGAARPECAMQGVTGESCPEAVGVPVQASSTSTVKAAARPAITHRQEAAVPPPAEKKEGSFFGKIKDFFKPDEVKGGIAFGAAIGMILLSATPVGIIGGALIGAVIGAVVVGNVLGKLWHAVFK